MLNDVLIFNRKRGQLVYHKKIRSALDSNQQMSASSLAFFFSSIQVLSESANLGPMTFYELHGLLLALSTSDQYIAAVVCDPADGEALPIHLAEYMKTLVCKLFKDGQDFQITEFEGMLDRCWVKMVQQLILNQLTDLQNIKCLQASLLVPDMQYHQLLGDKLSPSRNRDLFQDLIPVIQSYVCKVQDYDPNFKKASIQISKSQNLLLIRVSSCILVCLLDDRLIQDQEKEPLKTVMKQLDQCICGLNTTVELVQGHGIFV